MNYQYTDWIGTILRGLFLDFSVKTTWITRILTIGCMAFIVSCGPFKDGWRYIMNGMEETMYESEHRLKGSQRDIEMSC